MDSPVSNVPSGAPSQAPWWSRAFGAVLEPWVRIRRDASSTRITLDPNVPVCYVTERYGMSDTLILEQACREAGLPEPLQPLHVGNLRKKRSMFALSRRAAWIFRRQKSLTHSATLAQLLDTLRANPDSDMQLVPVSIFVGRAPDKETGWFSVLFSENWVVVGRFRRLLAMLLEWPQHDRAIFAARFHCGRCIADERDAPQRVRKIGRVLRVHFQRIRAIVIGPDLSHRRTLIDAVMNAAPVREAIADRRRERKSHATKKPAPARATTRWKSRRTYSHPFVRSVSFLLIGFWNKIYDGVHMHHFEKMRAAAPGHEIIYVPCHRSHIDYLLMSFLLYRNGVVVPHIAAGVNLNLPVLGPMLRRGGAFFLRRSFKANALYSTVFSEYVAQLFARGASMEYFIEGGRSRTGRLLQPRAGMLAMTVSSYLRAAAPAGDVPAGVHRLRKVDGRQFATSANCPASRKKRNRIFGLLRAFGILRKHYGKVVVNFGEPDRARSTCSRLSSPIGAAPSDSPDEKPAWFSPAVDDAGRTHPDQYQSRRRCESDQSAGARAVVHAETRDDGNRSARADRTQPRAVDRAAVFRPRDDYSS